ncbi:MAG: YchJ family protein [Reinekea sp.]|jgi:SEC-C motif domain protein
MKNTDPCPCGSSQLYKNCCGRYLEAGAYPLDAESLMRSRYTAYTLNRTDYLKKTWHPDTCPALDTESLQSTRWLRLDVIQHKPGLKNAIVEFKAYYQTEQGEQAMHEVSTFKKLKNRWVYVDAQK